MDDDELRQTSGNILGTFSYKPSSTNYIDIPTSVGWLQHSGALVAGYVNSNNLVMFDLET